MDCKKEVAGYCLKDLPEGPVARLAEVAREAAADGMVLLEIKAPGAVPLWLAHILGELDVFPTGFSKYGVCYRDNILEKYINGVITCV